MSGCLTWLGLRILVVALIGGAGGISIADAQATVLSEKALFERCYSQISGLAVSRKSEAYQKVVSGNLKATDACLSILDKAKFVRREGQMIALNADAEAKAVLANFHRLHASWFEAKDFVIIDREGYARDVQNIYDSTTPALYITRALFGPMVQYRSIATESKSLRAFRTSMNPTKAAETGHRATDYVFDPPIEFAPRGELLGVQNSETMSFSFPDTPNPKPGGRKAGAMDVNSSIGGGLLGTNAYLLLNTIPMSTSAEYKTDGAIQMHRRWGQAVFKDLLCRELPVVRESDVVGLVDPKSVVPFRNSSSCTKCHASMDRAASTIRNYKLFTLGKSVTTDYGEQVRGGMFPSFHSVSAGAEVKWPTEADPDYYRRPPNGTFYFRTSSGDLIDQQVTSVADLGSKISDTDDFYICAAKRYYKYFTGIEVNNSDLADPYRTTVLTKGDLAHREIVMNLGKKLKSHQSLRTLISDILNLSSYRKSDFGQGGVEDGQ